jgi:nitrogen regulatory protein P-II 1
MKLITAVLQPDRLDDALRAAADAGAAGVTVTEVVGFGQQYGHQRHVDPEAEQILVVPKVRIDLIVHDESVDKVVAAIAEKVRTPAIGDGKIWVSAIDGVLRIRTGERDGDAI